MRNVEEILIVLEVIVNVMKVGKETNVSTSLVIQDAPFMVNVSRASVTVIKDGKENIVLLIVVQMPAVEMENVYSYRRRM